MRRKVAFVYNFFMNLLAFLVIFPSDVNARTLYWEDVFPLDLPAMVQEADKRLQIYQDARFRIKNSFPYEQDWVFAEYALEQARLHTVARALTLSPAKLYCERASGRVWQDICLAHLLPAEVLDFGRHHRVNEDSAEQLISGQDSFGQQNSGQQNSGQQNFDQESPNAYLRDFDYRLWFCYYKQNYALYHLKQSFYYLQFDGRYQDQLFTEAKEYRALLLNSICLDPPEANPSLAFKVRYPGNWVEYGCYQEVLPKATLAYQASISDLRHEHASPVPCAKILGYLESAGLGEIHEDKVVRFYTGQYLKKYPLPLAGREGLCE